MIISFFEVKCLSYIETKEEKEIINNMTFKIKKDLLLTVFAFCFVESFLVFLQSTSQNSLKRKKITENFYYLQMFFIIFFVNTISVISVVFGLRLIQSGNFYKRLVFLVYIVFILLKLSFWININVLKILGFINPEQEMMENAFRLDQKEELLGINQSKRSKILNFIHKKVFKFPVDSFFYYMFIDQKHNEGPKNKVIPINFATTTLRNTILPHSVVIMFNFHGFDFLLLRLLLYISFSFFRIYCYIKLIMVIFSLQNFF